MANFAPDAPAEAPPHWLAVLAIAGGAFLLVTSEFLPIGLLSRIAADFGATQGALGLAVTIPGAAAAIAAPALAIWAGRMNRRWLLAALCSLIILSNLIVAFAPNVAVLYLGRVLLGIGVGGTWTFAVAAARRIVPGRLGARATAIVSAAIAVGAVVGVPIGVLIGSDLGWRAPFFCAAALGALIFAIQLSVLPSLPSRATVGVKHILAVLRGAPARAGLIAVLFIAGGQFAAYTYLEPFLTQVSGLDAAQLSLALALYGLAGLAGTAAVERINAWLGARWSFIGAAILLAATILATVSCGTQPVVAMVLVAAWGAAFGAVPVCINIWMFQADPENFEGGSALVVASFQIALATGALAGGLTVDHAGVRMALTLGAVCAALAAAPLLLLRGQTQLRSSPPLEVQ